jgi:hypothetical protein
MESDHNFVFAELSFFYVKLDPEYPDLLKKYIQYVNKYRETNFQYLDLIEKNGEKIAKIKNSEFRYHQKKRVRLKDILVNDLEGEDQSEWLYNRIDCVFEFGLDYHRYLYKLKRGIGVDWYNNEKN